MITIHEGTANTFTDNGIAVIEPLSCNFIVNINGSWSLELEMPFDEDQKFKKLQKGNIIKIDDIPVITEQQSNYQLFRIYDDVLTLTSVKVIAFPVAFEATYDAIIEEEYTTGDTAKTLTQIMAGAIDYLNDKGVTKYSVTVDYPSTPTKTASYQDTNLLAMIAGTDDTSILNTWNTEAVYDNYNIKIKQKIGDQSSDYEVRYGKNLTGLSVDTDTSGVVTRLFPKSAEGIRLNLNNNSYIDADNASDYPYVRGGFVSTPYSLVDTDDKSHSACAKLTRQAKTAIKNAIYDDVRANWLLICSGETIGNIFFEPEYIKTVLNDVISMLQEDEDIIDPAYNASLKSLIKLCIKDGVSWIKDQEIADYNWSGSAGSWKYGNTQRDISNQYIFVDKKYSWFDENGIWHPEKDDEDFKWIQKKGDSSAKKFGNNSKYFAHDTWVYTMSGDTQEGASFNQYKFNADGWWTGTSEASEWSWQQDSVSGKWWFGKVGATSESQWAHDCWLYIYDTNQPGASKSLYYFGSDGYMVPSLTTLVNWSWHQDKNYYWFGSDNKEQNAVYVADQWLKINGEWIYFMDNHPMNSQAAKILLYDMFKDIILDAAGSAIEYYADELYALLYNNMKDYCENLFAKGLSNPTITVTANVVDLSKTTEYADYGSLMTMHLGDKVRVIDYEHFNAEYYLRVVGLKYDCIRGFNTEVTIGDLSKTVTQMVSPSIGKTEGDKLVPGDNVTIDGNVINVINQSGDIFPGTDVQIDQLVTGGTALARIYLDGVPITIYGTEASITPTQLSGNKIADFNINGQSGSLYSPPASGLQYWTETEKEIEKLTIAELPNNRQWECDDYWKTSDFEIGAEWFPNYPYYYRKIPNTGEVCGCYSHFIKNGTVYLGGFMISLDDDACGAGVYGQGNSRVMDYTYKGKHCYISERDFYYGTLEGEQQAGFFVQSGTIHYLDYYSTHNNTYGTWDEVLEYLLEVSHFRFNDTYYSGIGNNKGYVIYGGYTLDDTPEPQDMPFYVTDNGIIKGQDFVDKDGNSISGGGLSKTELYSASGYSQYIGLSDDYTDYSFLLIQTYNSEDNESLSTMLNVSDLATGNRIGIDDYLLYTITNSTTLTFYSSFDDTNHTRYIKAVYGLKTFYGDAENAMIDFKLNDSSVVVGGVGFINDFSVGNAGTVPAPSSGDTAKFLRGDGTWQTVSAASSVATLTDVDLQNLANGQILKYNSTSQKWENASESGGTTVVANPSGTATTDLTKLQVGNDIYSIPSGGGVDLSLSENWDYFSKSINYTAETLRAGEKKKDVAYFTKASMSALNRQLLLGAFNVLARDSSDNTVDLDVTIRGCADLGTEMGVFYIATNNTSTDATQIGYSVSFVSPKAGSGGGGGASALEDLTDVDLTTPSDGELLGYDANSQKWKNIPIPLSAVEITSNDYANLSQAEKEDATKLYFVNDNGTVTTDILVATYTAKREGSMTITLDTANNDAIFAWNGGSQIAAQIGRATAIPATANKLKFKIQTGSSAYSTSVERFKIGIGLLPAYTSNTVFPDTAYTSNWLVLQKYNTLSSVWEGEIDLSNVTQDSYLYVVGHGWNMTVDYVKYEETGSSPVRLMYKDFNYTGGAS